MLRFTCFCLLSLALHLGCAQLLAQSLGGVQRPLTAPAAPLAVQFVLQAPPADARAASVPRPALPLPLVAASRVPVAATQAPAVRTAAVRPAPTKPASTTPAPQPVNPPATQAQSRAAVLSSVSPASPPVAAREVFSSQPQFSRAPSAPVYPSQARRRNQQGMVLVEVRLDAQGAQRERRLLRSSGVGSLDQAALTAVAGWQFRAEVRDGQAVPSRLHIPIQFTLASSR